ncbi:MAG: hypothetical protein OEY91_09590 [Nitrospirota bacterium]|nr:hypothetical protein [Nitrospirota bacterium]
MFDAWSVLPVREHEKLVTCLREAAPAKAGNAAGGFFQQAPHYSAGLSPFQKTFHRNVSTKKWTRFLGMLFHPGETSR